MTPAAILYYFPGAGAGGFGATQLLALPVALRAKFATHTLQDSSTGPDGSRGLCISWQEDVSLSHDRKAYVWRRVDQYWVGIRNGYRPEEFAHQVRNQGSAVSGYAVTLGDGQPWLVPIARANSPAYDIPWRETLDEEGNLLRETEPRYAAVCHGAGILCEHCAPDGVFTMDEAELRLICAHILAVNYRLDMQEILMLGLLTRESYRAIVLAVLDLAAPDDPPPVPVAKRDGTYTDSAALLPAVAAMAVHTTPEP